MIYIVFFMISFAFCSVGERLMKKEKVKKSRIYFFLSILTVSFLAGVRDLTIGTDIMSYSHWHFLWAEASNNLINYINISDASVEILYRIFVYLVSVFFKNEHWLYFWTGFFIYSFTLVGFIKLKSSCSVSWVWLAYLFLMYGDTLNAMRQCMALALIVFGFSYLLSNDYKKYIAISIVALFFHVTAIFGFVILGCYWILKKDNSFYTKALIILGAFLIMFLYCEILSLFINIGLLNEKFNRYIVEGTVLASLNPLLIRLPFVLIIGLFYKSFSRENRTQNAQVTNEISSKVYADFLIVMIILEIMFALMRNVNLTLSRIAFYFCIFRCVGTGVLLNKVSKSNKGIIKTGFLIFLVVYWIYQNVVQGNNEIYPFTSELLGIY